MLILLKEDDSGLIRDVVINPAQVVSIEKSHSNNPQQQRSRVSLTDGKVIIVVGEVLEISKKLNGKTRNILKG